MNKYLTIDVEDNYNVCHVGNPRSVSGLNAEEKTRLRMHQSWDVEYLDLGYYLISPTTDTTRKLAAVGDYEMMKANVWAAKGGNSGTWHQRQQWKIVPNIDGGYRIVSKGADNTQVLTVAYGDTANFTNVQMSQYHGTQGQQWTFKEPGLMECYGNANQVAGHTIQYVESSYKYRCSLCGLFFESPAQEDFSNHLMSMQDRALIFSLQRAALYEELEGDKDAFVQSCYKIIDTIRASYNGYYVYEFSDTNGNYISPVDYKYTASTIKTRVEITVRTKVNFSDDTGSILWYAGEALPFPFNFFSTVLLDYFEEYQWCTFKEALHIAGCAIVDGALQKWILGDDKEATMAIAHACLSNSVVNGTSTITGAKKEVHIQISLQGEEGTHNFSGIYRVSDTTNHKIYVVKESHSSAEGQCADYEPNEIDCTYWSEEGYFDIKPYDEIF